MNIEVYGTSRGEFIIAHDGKPVAVLVAYDKYEDLIETLNVLSDDDTMDAIDEALTDIANGELEED